MLVRFAPSSEYSKWRNPKRSLRRQLIKAGVISKSGRQWTRYRKEAVRAYKADRDARAMEGVIDANPSN